MKRPSPRAVLDILTSLVLIIAASTLIYKNVFAQKATQVEAKVPSEPLSIANSPIIGSANAQSIMVVFSDFECPFCGRFAREILPEIQRRYIAPGRVALVFHHLPLPMHQWALRAALTAECAGQQGQFWEMHDALFAQQRLDERVLQELQDDLAVDRQRFNDCLRDEGVRDRVQASANEAGTLGVRSTPTFFFGVRVKNGGVKVSATLTGAQPVQEFAKLLDVVLGINPTGLRAWWPFGSSS